MSLPNLDFFNLQDSEPSAKTPFWIYRKEWEKPKIYESREEIKDAVGPKQIEKDLIYLRMASVWAENSHCNRRKVGCLIVKDKSIISDGYNGTPTGFSNDCEDCNDATLPTVLHAEANAISKLARGTQTSAESTLYVTLSPCYECAKLIIQAGIRRVVFQDLYRETSSLSLLVEGGIELVRIK